MDPIGTLPLVVLEALRSFTGEAKLLQSSSIQQRSAERSIPLRSFLALFPRTLAVLHPDTLQQQSGTEFSQLLFNLQLYFEKGRPCAQPCAVWCLTFHEVTFFRSFWCPSSSADNWSLRIVRAFFVVRPKLEVISSWGARKKTCLVLSYFLFRLFLGGWLSTLPWMPCTHHHVSDSPFSRNHLPFCEL